MPSVRELLSRFEEAGTCADAERSLDEIAAAGPSDDLPLGDFYDELATEVLRSGARLGRRPWRWPGFLATSTQPRSSAGPISATTSLTPRATPG